MSSLLFFWAIVMNDVGGWLIGGVPSTGPFVERRRKETRGGCSEGGRGGTWDTVAVFGGGDWGLRLDDDDCMAFFLQIDDGILLLVAFCFFRDSFFPCGAYLMKVLS